MVDRPLASQSNMDSETPCGPHATAFWVARIWCVGALMLLLCCPWLSYARTKPPLTYQDAMLAVLRVVRQSSDQCSFSCWSSQHGSVLVQHR